MAVIAGTCFGSAARRSPETEAHPGGPEGGTSTGTEASTTGSVTEGSEEHPAAQTVHQSAPKAHFLPKRPQPSRKTAATPPNLQTQAQPSHLPAPHATSPTLPSERSDDPRTNEPTRRAERSDEPRRAPSTRHQLAKRRLGGFRPRPRSSKEGRAERTSVREHARRRWTAGIGRKPPSLQEAAAQRAYIADQPIPRKTRKRPMTATSNLRSARRLTTRPQPIANVWSPFAKWYDTPSVPST